MSSRASFPSEDRIIKSLGFALAFGAAAVALLVRMTIVPAVLSLLGKSVRWLPGCLDKILPNVSQVNLLSAAARDTRCTRSAIGGD